MSKLTIEELYKQMYLLTHSWCTKNCKTNWSCCSSEYCEMAISWTKEDYGINLLRTDHPRLSLMSDRCTVKPMYRPLCTVHICERALMYDLEFSEIYFELRDKLSTAEYNKKTQRG